MVGAPRDDPLGQRPASGSATAARPVAQACQWAALALVNGVVISELEGLLWTAAHPLPGSPPFPGPPGIESTLGSRGAPDGPHGRRNTAELVTVRVRPTCGTFGCIYRRR